MSTVIKNYTFTFEELQIQSGEIEELMGFEPGHSPEPFPELIDEGIKIAPAHTNIKGGFVIFKQVKLNRE
jgi:hypothetical protein